MYVCVYIYTHTCMYTDFIHIHRACRRLDNTDTLIQWTERGTNAVHRLIIN